MQTVNAARLCAAMARLPKLLWRSQSHSESNTRRRRGAGGGDNLPCLMRGQVVDMLPLHLLKRTGCFLQRFDSYSGSETLLEVLR